ncbi:MAG: hypothetical protein E7812_14870 [Phenylobacterium sp.]|nr:MAG: hypothetical protein E7812_14870 [Phenylobacterium sp.]
MRSFVLYGLDLADQVLATETLRAEGLEAARLLARTRLLDFPKVELWSEAVCVYRNRRPPAPPSANA